MLVQAAEARFQKGLAALEAGRGREALALFEASIELERRLGARAPQARYLSFYGLCLALETDQKREGSNLCRQAISLEFFNADLSWNYGRVLLVQDRRKEAYQAFLKGLTIQRNHQGILRELGRMGWRKPPVLAFLDRSHPLNVALGKIFRASKQAPSTSAAPPRSPRTSGSTA